MSIAHTCIYDTLESCKYAKYWYGKPVVSKCKDCNRNPNNYPKTQVGTKDEMKNKYRAFITEISEILGLGKPIDILKLCATTDLFFQPLEKRIAELEKENAELKSKNCWKTCEYAEPKSQWISQHIQDVEQLTKAKEIIKEMLSILPKENIEGVYEITEEAEQFIKE